ncbi:DEAD/DEAH box helicase [Roseimaritima sediminicola]|uniref:DEAD/DEAH box helicase n=1 Tax=Roseimaritima sediminicola TaxID=2662066 RepID=UPI00138694A7|nr:DEAD/DEAH box helicase [Roseimaritima sediminicola]
MAGEHLASRGGVQTLQLGTGGVRAYVSEQRGNFHKVEMSFGLTLQGYLEAGCECSTWQRGYTCRHVWAVASHLPPVDPDLVKRGSLQIVEILGGKISIGDPIVNNTNGSGKKKKGRSTPLWQKQLQKLGEFAAPDEEDAAERLQEVLQVGSRCWFVLNVPDHSDNECLTINLYQASRKQNGEWGKPTSATLDIDDMDEIVDAADAIAVRLLEPVQENAYGYRYHMRSRVGKFTVRPETAALAMQAMSATGRLVWDMGSGRSLVEPHGLKWDGGEPFRLVVRVAPHTTEDGKKRIRVSPVLVRGEDRAELDDALLVSESGVVVFPQRACPLDVTHTELIQQWRGTGAIDVPSRSISKLMETIAGWGSVRVELDPELPVSLDRLEPRPRLHLSSESGKDKHLVAAVQMCYGEQVFAFGGGPAAVWDKSNKQFQQRDLDAEQRLVDQLPRERFFDHGYNDIKVLRKALPALVSELSEAGWDVVADGNALRRAGSFQVAVNSEQDWFDLDATADFDGVQVALPELLSAARKGQNFVVLDDGTHGILPEQWLSQFAGLDKTGEVAEDSIRFTKTQALLLDALLSQQEEVALDRAFRAWCEKLNSFEGIRPVPAPADFQGSLRDYQQLGLGWFQFLQEFQLGGCLADDMGLGKTIQVLAMLAQRYGAASGKHDGKASKNDDAASKNDAKASKSGDAASKSDAAGDDTADERRPSLIVVPKSLIFNWLEEAARFTPQLRMLNYTGTGRGELREQFSEVDCIVTTYGTVRNDAKFLHEQAFDYVILDEAQAIKNPASLSAKATRVLRCDHRLAMTGTPIENHLGDLWSLFDFLNPGMLGQAIGDPSKAGTDRQRLEHISTALRPFILRRTKEQVLTELPAKTEQTLYCDMHSKQNKLYGELRDHYRTMLSDKIKTEGLAKSKIHVLEALLRLRQAACDPRLVDRKSDVHGAKIARLLEQLEEVVSEGHKALVFSQFTSLLALVRQELDERGWKYEYLDGKTRKRAEKVKRFQEDDECPLFLISLKAGGHGLNLTAADYVFIMDPWWNPAVESQAIDRAHRMGQTKPVVAYRMICRDTVEDKIVALQSSKRELADAIISQEKSLISDLTSDDLRMLFE